MTQRALSLRLAGHHRTTLICLSQCIHFVTLLKSQLEGQIKPSYLRNHLKEHRPRQQAATQASSLVLSLALKNPRSLLPQGNSRDEEHKICRPPLGFALCQTREATHTIFLSILSLPLGILVITRPSRRAVIQTATSHTDECSDFCNSCRV